MGLVPHDYPDHLARAGLRVHVFAGWESHGGDADHRAVVIHHTASGASTRPEDDAAYCHHGSSDSPLYNVMVSRDGDVWLLAREKSNNAGKISGVALNEALRGEAGHVSAGARGLHDDTSANASLFGLSAQNDGSGEQWSPALVNSIALVANVTCGLLGLHAGHCTIHRVLTARKVDTCGPGCPDDWQPAIRAATGGGPPEAEDDVWVLNGEVPAGTGDEPGDLTVALPYGFKSARVDLWLDCDHREGAALWAAQQYEGGSEAVGLWGGGHQWELWLPGRQRTNTGAIVDASAHVSAIRVQNRGPNGPVLVTVSGT